MSADKPDPDAVLLDKVLHDLMEHFDCVQIFIQQYNGDTGKTRTMSKGRGNWLARYGQVQLWCDAVREEERLEQRDSHDDEEE